MERMMIFSERFIPAPRDPHGERVRRTEKYLAGQSQELALWMDYCGKTVALLSARVSALEERLTLLEAQSAVSGADA